VFFNLLGVDFGSVLNQIDFFKVTKLVQLEQQSDIQQVQRGRNVHTIFVSISIVIAFLTVILAFIDYKIKQEPSTLVVGVALFCSGLFASFHILVSTQLINIPDHQFYVTSYTWFFCRLFHASMLMCGAGIFLFHFKSLKEENIKSARKFVTYISITFIALTVITILVLFFNSDVPPTGFPYRNTARRFDLIPLILYLASAIYILPKFYERYPSVFSKALLLSVLPATATQLYMAFGSVELFDNSFNISHFTTAFTYFIPFAGLSLNYLQTHKNERQMNLQLNVEVHERKIVEETLSGVLNSSLSAIMAFKALRNQMGKIIDFEWSIVNPAEEKIFGLDYRTLTGNRLSNKLPELTEEGWLEMFTNVVENGEPLNHEYYSLHKKKWLHMVGVKLEDGLAVTISDISKRKNALNELMTAEKLAVTGRISRTIAHEVRNPLTNINLSLDQVKNELKNPDESVQMYLDIITRNSERINRLITELLNSSKPAELRMSNYALDKLMDESLFLASDRIKLKGVTLKKNYAPQRIIVHADDDKLKTAFLNLIINAVEAMEASKGILTIELNEDNGTCKVIIEDNGSGIEEDNLKKLFEPFFSKKSEGMGLGLTATQNIILTHNGTIDVERMEYWNVERSEIRLWRNGMLKEWK
jgi:nitrogen-specific signal transduction histidine kinase